MSRSHPVLRILGQLLTPAGPNHFVYLSAHPEQDQAVLDALAMDVGTAPGYRLVADVDCFLLLADHDYQVVWTVLPMAHIAVRQWTGLQSMQVVTRLSGMAV